MPSGKHLSEEKKKIIFALKEQGLSPDQIALQLGVSAGAVRELIRREDAKRGVTPDCIR